MGCSTDRKIAVMMSSYNGEKYIDEQIQSIINQNVNGELVLFIRDDGSTDGTVEILKRYEVGNSNIKVEYGDNIGYNASFFSLFRKVYNANVDYEYFSIADQDDVWDVDKLQIAVENIERCEKKGPVLYGSSSRIVDAESRKVLGTTKISRRPITLYNTLIQNFFPGHSQVLNRELMKKVIESEVDVRQIYVYDSYILNVAMIYGEVIFDSLPHTDYRQHRNNQLGFSKSFFSWCKQRLQRLKKGDQTQYAIQIQYIVKKFWSDFSNIQQKEVQKFTEANCCFCKRVVYAFKTKLYRQGRIENILFKILYICGAYRVKENK